MAEDEGLRDEGVEEGGVAWIGVEGTNVFGVEAFDDEDDDVLLFGNFGVDEVLELMGVGSLVNLINFIIF